MRRLALPTALAGALAATTVLALTLGPGTAAATPPLGPPVTSPSPVPEYTVDTRVRVHSDGVRLSMPKDAVVRTFTLTYRPGNNSGWHQHPGVVLATVVSGTVFRTTPCRAAQRFSAGDVFTEVGPHFVENQDATDAVLSITQIAPAGTTGAAFREDLPQPVCPRHSRGGTDQP